MLRRNAQVTDDVPAAFLASFFAIFKEAGTMMTVGSKHAKTVMYRTVSLTLGSHYLGSAMQILALQPSLSRASSVVKHAETCPAIDGELNV